MSMPVGLRTLFITGHRIHPPIGGAALRNWQNVNIAAAFGPVAIFSVLEQRAQERLNPPNVLALTTEYEPGGIGTSGASGWLHRKLWPFRTHGLPRADRAFEPAGMDRLRGMVQHFQPNVLVLEELWPWRYLEGVLHDFDGDLRVVYDAHNVEATLRESIQMSIGQDQSGSETWKQAVRKRLFLRGLMAVERHLVTSFDQVLACSSHDREELIRLYGDTSPIAVVPNGINMADYDSLAPRVREADNNFRVLFVGSFSYVPNEGAAEYMIRDVMPLVWSRYPGCRLMLVGRDPTASMRGLASADSRLILTGSVPDVRPYLGMADVVVAPLHVGSGTRFKILESFAARRPVVATSKGAEGLAVEDGVHLLIRDTAVGFADAIVNLIQSEDLVRTLAARAHDLVTARYSWTEIAGQLANTLETVLDPTALIEDRPLRSPHSKGEIP